MTKEDSTDSCKCDSCQSACRHKPGWFKPEQVKVLLDHFKVNSIRDLLEAGFAIDWWTSNQDILVLAPNIIGNEDRIQYPGNPRGVCVFYNNGLCDIHDIRPFECAALLHGGDKYHGRHESVAKLWKESPILDKFEDEITPRRMMV